ncbi:hypothetical protein V1514DRAFT_334665 [Lipomyces japonicus]|uniref:uncharacterized protein n=1 Tax=Lipomyces japonicus TaxID=56871 RepID=UPI0034CEFE86
MGKPKTENSKKAAGNARKAETAREKQAAVDRQVAEEEDREWSKGSKSKGKKDDAEAKKAEAARKKQERDAALQAEMDALPTKPKIRGADKSAAKKANKLDDFLSNKDTVSLSASGIENALDALSVSGVGGGGKANAIERHPERRYKAAYAAYEERRLPQVKEEYKGLRLNQMKELIHKEFEKSEENPFNQVSIDYNASQSEIAKVKENVKRATENRLSSK